tara:strand:- start:479 stop:1462 length:984 start_codon:yes stop_codon:yes gene_type:complete
MNKVLLTGGAGFFGSHIAEKLIDQGYPLIIIDSCNDETTQKKIKKNNLKILKDKSKKLNSYFKFYEEDIKNENEILNIFKVEKPEILIHAASLVMDRASVDIPIEFIKTNIEGSQILINAVSSVDTFKKIVFISSRSAIGETVNESSYIKENDNFKPINPYGASKAAAESFFYSFHSISKMPLTICRMQPMYGPRCRHDMLIWRVLDSILSGSEINKYGDGNAIRDWLHVYDAVNAILKIIEFKSEFEIFNIGTGIGTSTNEIIRICEKISKKKANIVKIDSVKGDAYFAGLADCSEIEKKLNWKAEINIEDGIQSTFKFMKNFYLS